MSQKRAELDSPEVKKAIKETEALVSQMKTKGPSNFSPAYAHIEKAVTYYKNAGYDLDTLFPAKRGVARFKAAKTGEDYWNVFSKLLHEKICDPNGELVKLVDKGVKLTAPIVFTFMLASFNIPVAAISIIVGITAILVENGIQAYCKL